MKILDVIAKVIVIAALCALVTAMLVVFSLFIIYTFASSFWLGAVMVFIILAAVSALYLGLRGVPSNKQIKEEVNRLVR